MDPNGAGTDRPPRRAFDSSVGDFAWHEVGAFDGPDFASKGWARAFELGEDGARCYYQEANARVQASGGTLQVRVDRFGQHSGTRQTIDNAKHVYVARNKIEIQSGDVVEIKVAMGAERLGDRTCDYRDGFAAFNVIDEEFRLVYDTITTGDRALAVHESLAATGGFTWIVDAPLLRLSIEPRRLHDHIVTIDTRGKGRAEYRVDGQLLFALDQLSNIPRALRVALGLFTLHPICNGISTSVKGQGMAGWWKDVQFRRLPRP